VQATFGSIAFWLDQSLGVYNVWFGVWMLLSGYLIPIELMPEAIAGVVRWTPFHAMLGAPVEIAAGLLRGTAAMAQVGVQLVWLVVALVVMRAVWARGLRRYGAFGA
jgi:ABC-2 type transport system permease protein